MRAKNILHLGVKELWSLARDPMMLVLIVSPSRCRSIRPRAGCRTRSTRRRSPSWTRTSRRCRSVSSMPSSRRCSCRRRWCRGRRWTPGWTPDWTPSPSTSRPGSRRTCWPGASPRSSSTPTRPAWGRRSRGSGYVQTIIVGEVQTFLQRYRMTFKPPVDIEERVRFNANLTRSWFGAVVAVIDMITMLSVLLTGAALIRERERGTVEHLLVMPVTPFEIMTSKVWSMGLVVLVASAVSLKFVVQGVLSVPIHGSIRLFLCGAMRAPVRHHVAGHVPGHLRPHDAAVRPADDHGAAALADALRRQVTPAGEHAPVRSADHAGGAHHPFRHAGPGHPVPRRGAGGRLAAVPRPRPDRRNLVQHRAGTLPQDHRNDGVVAHRLQGVVDSRATRRPAALSRPGSPDPDPVERGLARAFGTCPHVLPEATPAGSREVGS